MCASSYLLQRVDTLAKPKFSQPSVTRQSVTVNGREYRLPVTTRPIVGILCDGSAQEYIDAAVKAGCMPYWARVLNSGHEQSNERTLPEPSIGQHGLVATVMPTFTNPNNVAVVTGVTPNVNGICGNYFYDPGAFNA